MADTYFDYTLSKCRRQGISNVCEKFSTCNELIDIANSEYIRCKNITADWRLYEALEKCFNNPEIINPQLLGKDALIIYRRCSDSIFSENRLNYDRLFDALVEVNWLLASIYNSENIKLSHVVLLSNPAIINKALKGYLHNVFKDSIQYSLECEYIKEAKQAKKKILTGLYPFQYEESKYYVYNNFTMEELDQIWGHSKMDSLKKRSLYLGLTATAALADNIQKGWC